MKALSTFLLVALAATLALGQTVSYTYDNMGNRTARNAGGGTTPPAAGCYTFTLASNTAKKLTEAGGIVKVKDSNGSNAQIWNVENVGAQVRISANNGSVLAVQGSGNTDGNLITLQPSGSEDHKLWTRTILSGNEVFVRKNSTLIFGSAYNWGDGDPNNTVTDIKLVNDPSYTYGWNKWILASTTCPNVTPPPTCFVIQLPSPAYDRKMTNVGGIVKVKPGSGANNQKWIVETVGAQVRIASAVGNSVLAVQGGGNTVGNLITLQTSGSEDYKLWTRTPLGSGLEALVRKNSTHRIGSAYDWGNGNPSDAVTDIQLADDPGNSYGSNKWQFVSTTCPAARTSVEDVATVIPLFNLGNARESELPQELTAFPNPSGGEFEASFYVSQGQQATLSLNDMLGRELWRKTVVGEGVQREKITLSEAAAGTYLLVLRREGAGPRTVGPQRAVESQRVLISR